VRPNTIHADTQGQSTFIASLGVIAHLLAASPTCHYLEYVDWADAILEEPLQIQDGLARVPDRPGIGLTWRSEAVKALSLDL
jgi:mandelate racemase